MASYPGTLGNDTLDGGTTNINDTLSGGLGNDLYRYSVGSGNDVIVDTGGVDTLQLGDPNNLNPIWDFYRSGTGGKDLVIDFFGQGRITVTNQFLGAPIVETLAFADDWGSYSISNGVTGTAGSDLLVGTSAAETITGNAGDDLLFAGAGNDTVLGGDGDDEIYDGLGNDSIVGGAGDDYIEIGGGANVIVGGTGWDDVSYFRATQGVTINLSGQAQGTLSDGHVLKSIGVEDTLTSIESVYGSDFADVFFGGRTTGDAAFNAGSVQFNGGGGNDTFHVGSGLNGDGAWATVGYGDDQAGVVVNLSDASITVNGVLVASKTARDGAGGTDTFALSGDKIGINGSDFNDYIQGQSSVRNAYLSGGAGNDTIVGGSSLNDYTGYDAGHDGAIYGAIVNLSASAITVTSTTGVTGVTSSVTVSANHARDSFGDTDTLQNIESISGSWLNDYIVGGINGGWFGGQEGNDTLMGGAGVNHIEGGDGNDKLIGGASGDWLFAGAGNDVLNGGLGNDELIGGAGNDTYVINTLADVVIEQSGEGTDLIQSAISYSLLDTDGPGANGGNVENLQLTGSAPINGTGNALANVLYAGVGNNVLDGGTGTDTVSYLYGVSGTTGVTVSLALASAQATGGSGSDTLLNIENLTGSAYADNLTGNSAANVLDGGAGIDTMTGGDGSDTYYVRDVGDSVSETNATASTGGTDTVYSYLTSYTLGTNVENGRILSTGLANLTGNTLSNVLYAGVGSNVLDGSTGTDTVSYAYATAGVQVSLVLVGAQATGGSGSDTLIGIENLTGSAYADSLTGNSAANVLDGGAGIDTMTGGDGSDTYYVRDVGDSVSETNATASTGGTDTVYSYLTSYTLGTNVENGRILSTGSANLTGNSLNNVLYAGVGNNLLDGSTGTDTVSYAYGVTGTTGVTVNLSSTTAQATGGSGIDTLISIENLAGSNFNDSLTGNSAVNVLDGGTGIDTMTGGDGSDSYYVRDVGDLVSETNGSLTTGGTDTVYSYLSAYTLTANVENGRILASVAANLTGNSLANVLYAGTGNNVLNGVSGVDTVSYQYATAAVSVSLATTVAQVTGGSGSDTLQNIDNLTGSNFHDTLIGDGNANTLSGLALNDYLNGGAGNDALLGGDGTDLLIGGLGKDLLTGGTGNDTFDFNALNETGLTSATWDVISDFVHGTDKIDLATLDANTALAGDQAFTAPVLGGTFSGAFASPGDLYFDTTAHVLYGNTDSDAAAEFAIELTGVTALATADFFL